MFKILIIDDDPIVQLILQKNLQEQGYTVFTANDGAAGVELAHQVQPALVICDWIMPGIDGLEVCRQIKATPSLSTAFFILLTSRSKVQDRVKGLDTGADDFLSKPIEIGELQARVRAGLRLYQSTQELQQLAADLQTQKQRLETELAEAADYVKSLLPAPLTGQVSSQALFVPSKQLGGDCFDYYWLDPDYLMLYLLDVSGHGLGAALMSVTVQNLIRSQSLPGINFYRPEEVLRGLNEIFQMDEKNPRYFTIWYGVYNRVQRRLTYASAGHPPALLLSLTEPTPQVQKLKTRGMPIGMMLETQYTCASCEVNLPSTLFILSDGVYELNLTNGSSWTLDQFITLMVELSQAMNQTGRVFSISRLLDHIYAATGSEAFEDDFSLLQVQFNP